MSRFKLIENEKPDKASQPNSLHFVLLCFLKSLSQRSGSPDITITLAFTEHTFMCFMFKDINAAFVTAHLQIPSGSYRLQKAFQDGYPVLSMNPSKHLYQSSTSWEKIKQAQIYNQANRVPTQLDT